MSNVNNPKAGLGALLTPNNCVLLLIDHQPFQFAGLRSHDTQTVVNNVVGLAKSAKLFGVPTLMSTVLEERGGYLIKPLQELLQCLRHQASTDGKYGTPSKRGF